MTRFLTILAAMTASFAVSAAVGELGAGLEFIAALTEKDAFKRTEMLLAAAESGVYPADLALIHLTRCPAEPSQRLRLRRLAAKRRGELIPAVLACRGARRDDPELFALAAAAWKNAAKRELSAFELPLFRELSASLVSLGCGLGEYATLRPLIEELIRSDRDWRRKLPVPALVEFYVSCAFAVEGFELPEPAWRDSPSALRQACIRLLDGLPGMLPDDPDEAGKLVNFFLRCGNRGEAVAAALGFGRKAPERALSLIVLTAVEAGDVKILDSMKKFIKPPFFAFYRVRALGAAGAYAEAFKELEKVADPQQRQALYFELVDRQGDPARKAELARDPKSGLPLRDRIIWLLGAAELRRDAGCFRDAEKLLTAELEADPVKANAAGYVALVLGIDPERAEKRVDVAVAAAPYNSAYLDSKAYARYVARDYPGAWEWMEKALRVTPPEPTSAEILEHAGDIRLALGDRQRAAEFYRAALKLAAIGAGSPSGAAAFKQLHERTSAKLEKLK